MIDLDKRNKECNEVEITEFNFEMSEGSQTEANWRMRISISNKTKKNFKTIAFLKNSSVILEFLSCKI